MLPDLNLDEKKIMESYEKFKSLKPIFIGGLSRSGTTLLLRLLDGHPELLVLPIENRFLLPFIYPSTKYNYTDFTDGLISKNPEKIFSSLSNNYSFETSRTEIPIDFRHIEHVFIQVLSNSRGNCNIYDVMQAFTYGYFHSIGIRDLSPYKAWVVKFPDKGKAILHYRLVFPQCRILHLVRDPRARFISIKKRDFGDSRTTSMFLKNILGLFNCTSDYRTSFVNVQTAKSCGGENIRVVRYEDLVLNTEDSMKAIASFLEITCDKILLQPILLNKPWVGNSSFGMAEEKVMGKIYTQSIDRWKKLVHWHERFLIEALLAEELVQYGYMRKIKWKRFKTFLGKMIRYILSEIGRK